MQRISVVGCSGAGKSTFARALGAVLTLEVLHLDKLFWTPEISLRPRPEQERRLEEALQRQAFILEGGYGWTYPRRIAACDTLIWLDTSPLRRFLWLRRRRSRWQDRIGHHPMDATTVQRLPGLDSPLSVLRQHLRAARHLEALFAAPPAGVRMIRLTGPAKAQAFLDSLRK